jgi:hypothetical protein
MWKQIGSGNNSNLDDAKSYEDAMDEGQRGQLVINFLISLPGWQIDGLRNSLNFAGVEDLNIVSSGSKLTITWRKGFAWIPVIILAVIALAILIVSWQMFKEIADVIKTVFDKLGSTGTILIVLVVAAALILPYFLRRKV